MKHCPFHPKHKNRGRGCQGCLLERQLRIVVPSEEVQGYRWHRKNGTISPVPARLRHEKSTKIMKNYG